ncbi:anti-sigma factor [Burkholderia sp. Ax-1719]|uniref:anti-sigma factor n=1 Tax=Burkholderia sp. Ax-1719 TaxID=2608334 RepID=UPI0014224AF6|nr:anti-sigma factor [Burkholderia sp. Ax-1719]NIE67514.1 anti-sigma factor [Burkholderia sp. Ax-1719]
MNCDEARPLVDASVDRELSAADEWRVREHLAGCVPCRRAVAQVEAISRLTREAPYHRAPEGLAARIVAALPSGSAETAPEVVSVPDRKKPARAGGWRDWLRPVFGGAGVGAPGLAWMGSGVLLLCALGVALTLHLRAPAADGAFIDELVASHIRAQISGRDIDVISTDRHTVKPWFNGRIDYAPPVEDFAAQGFPLVGGRLDYVGRERVAVLIYHFRKHVIDLYVFPPGSAGQAGGSAQAGSAPRASDGYSILRWQAAGMTWWAVTDAGPDALVGLRAALDARLADGSPGVEARP